MSEQKQISPRIIAALLTLLVGSLIVATLLLSHLTDPRSIMAQTKEEPTDTLTTELFFEPELLHLGDELDLTDNPAPAPQDFTAETPEPPAVQEETPAKGNVNSAPTPKKDETQEIARSMQSKFSGKGGSPKGDGAQAGAGGTGSGSAGSLKGRNFLGGPQIDVTVNHPVTIIVSVTVDAEGRVTEAAFKSDSGPGAGDAKLRRACVRASRQARWTERPGATPARGTITWTLTPGK